MTSVSAVTPSSGSGNFDKLRDHLSSNQTVRREVENAFGVLLARANPSDRAARFVVGGAVEWIIAAAAWSAKILTVPGGHNANGFDLTDVLDQAKGLWSIKFGSQKRPREWRITNGMGGAGKGFVEPTIFVHRQLGGLLYIDPASHPDVVDKVINDGDAAKLPFATTLAFATAHPECLAIVDVPVNEGQAANDPYAFVKTLLAPESFPNLARVFIDATPIPKSVSDEIRQLVDLQETGVLNADQLRLAIDKLLS